MKNVRTIILGAGPSGLALASALLANGDDDWVVFDKEDSVGGLCRSRQVDGSPLDIGGGHFLDIRRPEVTEFLFNYLPESEWDRHDRKSTIQLGGHEIDYPFEANLWQFPSEVQLDYLESIARAGCVSGQVMPESFRDWVTWKLGERIAQDYMIPYNEKIWSLDDLDRLGTYWLYKLPNVSFRDTLKSCLERKLIASMPGHAEFFYPKQGGYGHVWELMGQRLGPRLLLDRAPAHIDVDTLQVDDYQAERIVSTIPWCEFMDVAKGIPSPIREDMGALEFSSIEVGYHSEELPSKAHWTYVPDREISYHRLLLRHNFCPGSKGHWKETNTRRATGTCEWSHINKYAYPLNLRDKPERIARVLDWARQKRIIGAGRWGKWEHMNSDAAVEESLALARDLANGDG